MSEHATVEVNSAAESIAALNAELESLAKNGDWAELSASLAKRDRLLREMDETGKADALRESQKTTDRVRSAVESAKQEVGEKLAQLQRGKEATDSYRAHT